MKEQITLCSRCASDYREAGYKLTRDYTAKEKDECYICRRSGWEYYIDHDKRDKRAAPKSLCVPGPSFRLGDHAHGAALSCLKDND